MIYQYIWTALDCDGNKMWAGAGVDEMFLENMEVFKTAERMAVSELARMCPEYHTLRFEGTKQFDGTGKLIDSDHY